MKNDYIDYDLNELNQNNDLALMQSLGAGSPFAFNYGKKKEDMLGKWEIEFNEIIEPLIMGYRGYVKDEKNKTYKINPLVKPKINETGANSVYLTLKSFMHKGITLTKLKKEQINIIMKNICYSLVYDLDIHKEDYAIPDYSTMIYIINELEVNCLAMFSMALEGWTAENRIKSINITNSAVNTMLPQTKKSMLGSLFNRGGN